MRAIGTMAQVDFAGSITPQTDWQTFDLATVMAVPAGAVGCTLEMAGFTESDSVTRFGTQPSGAALPTTWRWAQRSSWRGLDKPIFRRHSQFAPLNGTSIDICFNWTTFDHDLRVTAWWFEDDVTVVPWEDAENYLIDGPRDTNNVIYTLDFSAVAGTAQGVLLRCGANVSGDGPSTFRFGHVADEDIILGVYTAPFDVVLPLTASKQLLVRCDQLPSRSSLGLLGFCGSNYTPPTGPLPHFTENSVPADGAFHPVRFPVTTPNVVHAVLTPIYTFSGQTIGTRDIGASRDTTHIGQNPVMRPMQLDANGEFAVRATWDGRPQLLGTFALSADGPSPPQIGDVNDDNTITAISGPINISGSFPNTLTSVTLGGVPLAIQDSDAGEINCQPLAIFNTPLPFGATTLTVTDDVGSADIAVTIVPPATLQVVTVAGVQPYLAQGLDVADGDQMACEVNAGGSTLTLTPDTDVVYSPALPDGTVHNRYWWDASAPGWDSSTVQVNRPGASTNPPVWRAAPNPPPATIGVPYSYAIGGLLDGKRPMTLVDAGTPLPSGLSYKTDVTPERIEGTPTVSGNFTGIVTRADNGE